jgi:hypothetical protein
LVNGVVNHQQVGTFQENPQMCYFEIIPSLKRNVNKSWLVDSNMDYFPFSIWDVIPTDPNPIDELHHFPEGGLSQPPGRGRWSARVDVTAAGARKKHGC